MVRVACEVYEALGLQSHLCRPLHGGVCLTLVGERLGDGSEVCVEDTFQTFEPCCGEFRVLLTAGKNSVEICLHSLGHFIV